MLSDIKRKLASILVEQNLKEADVVHILSLIRKILEIEGREKQKDYEKLKFYCDWALHSKIRKTEPVSDDLMAFIQGVTTSPYKIFHVEMKRFLKEFGLDTAIYSSPKNILYFEQMLTQIYTDIPLSIRNHNKNFTLKSGKLSQEKIGTTNVHILVRDFTITDIK